METAAKDTYHFPGQTDFYRGKVRDVHFLENDLLVMVASNRISAFDVILPKEIPYKGAVLNQIAARFLEATADICPNWFIGSPAPTVAVGKCCEPVKIEMVIRGYLTGHAWREYKSGKRELCGVPLPEGMKEHDKFPKPIITPATKADEGHDEDISREDILKTSLASEALYSKMEDYTRRLYARGTQMAAKNGLILVDTKYEFGLFKGELLLMDEIHTPDSSRYFYIDGYEERQQNGQPQEQLSKEFVREWLIENDFQGKEGQTLPEMTSEWVETISERYIELFEKLTGENFDRDGNAIDQEESYRKTVNYLEDIRS
jgi:phosphoribosylaminoimidazole-succinocarboxamide synthase